MNWCRSTLVFDLILPELCPNLYRDRIMVTVSCLIVIATLFSQMTSNMPPSAQPKAVDIFFFFYICRMFLVCLNHTYHYVRKWRREEKLQNIKKEKEQGRELTGEEMEEIKNEKDGEEEEKKKFANSTLLFQFVTFSLDAFLFAVYIIYIIQGRYEVTKFFTFDNFIPKQTNAAQII